MKVTFIISAVIGLAVSIAILSLLSYGVSGILVVGDLDFMYVFWPAAVLLTVGWRSTAHGISITVVAIALNCLTYILIGSVVRGAFRMLSKSAR